MSYDEKYSPDLFGRLGERERIFQDIEISKFNTNEFIVRRNLNRSIASKIKELKKIEEMNKKIEPGVRLKRLLESKEHGILIAKRDIEELLKCRMCGETRFSLHYDYYTSYSKIHCIICKKCAKREGYKEMDEEL